MRASPLVATRYYLVCLDPILAADVAGMIRRALDWELTKMNPQGRLDPAGSTRVGVDPGRGGKIKPVNYPEAIEAFVLAAQITRHPPFREAAQRIIRGREDNASR